MKEAFEKCDYEHTLFIKNNKEGKVLIVSLYVDDLIFTGNDESMFEEFKHSMKHEFDMIDLGKMRYFLGLENPPCLFVMEVRMARDMEEGILSMVSLDSMERMGNFPEGFLEGFRAAMPREGECRLRKSLELEP
ncbi:hypothetical protein MRB53_014569 [Persea americana]|uniref:Uncharacterized protein n=1 Tax=Persea americana TaxID=3435 RepID=A0ACC2KB73_PERAE|nr:hypothetical protein MRB53_014569 [Persea americana]